MSVKYGLIKNEFLKGFKANTEIENTNIQTNTLFAYYLNFCLKKKFRIKPWVFKI